MLLQAKHYKISFSSSSLLKVENVPLLIFLVYQPLPADRIAMITRVVQPALRPVRTHSVQSPAQQCVCVETCQCDPGVVLDGDICVPLSQCGSTHNGYHYHSNLTVGADDGSTGLRACVRETSTRTRHCAFWILATQVNNALCKVASEAVFCTLCRYALTLLNT